jgi:hypothetical protein
LQAGLAGADDGDVAHLRFPTRNLLFGRYCIISDWVSQTEFNRVNGLRWQTRTNRTIAFKRVLAVVSNLIGEVCLIRLEGQLDGHA